MIDSGATDHVAGIRYEFQSYTTTNDGGVRIAYGSYTHIAGRGTVRILPDLTLSSVLHIPNFSFNLLSVSALTKTLNCWCHLLSLLLCFSGSEDGAKGRWCQCE